MKRKIDADIYLDVDGVLFCCNNGILELRHGFIGFLWWLVNTFENCYWLTCWGNGFNDVLLKIYGGRIAERFKDSHWNRGAKEAKATGIQDWNRPFAWIEDGISEEEMKVLEEKGCVDNYIHMPYYGEMDKLYELKEELIKRFNIPSGEGVA